MAKESFSGSGVRQGARGTDDGMDNGPGSRSKEGKQGIKAVLLRRVEVSKVSIKVAEPKLRPVFPKVRDLALVKTTWCRSRRGGRRKPGRLDGGGRGCGSRPDELDKPLRCERIDLWMIWRFRSSHGGI